MDLNLTPKEQQEFEARVQQKQVKEFMNVFSNLVGKCFNDCINDFTTRSMNSKESGCVSKCVDKWMKGSERMGLRFGEMNAELMQNGPAAFGK